MTTTFRRVAAIFLSLATIIGFSSCESGDWDQKSQKEKGTIIGAAGGAVVGAAVTGKKVTGAIIGGTVGAIAGRKIGKEKDETEFDDYDEEYDLPDHDY